MSSSGDFQSLSVVSIVSVELLSISLGFSGLEQPITKRRRMCQ
jgi:hypothetical protein